MTREIMTRKASDNVYLHKDFHGALSLAIDYLDERYGADAVREFLRRFAERYFAPLNAELRASGLSALKAYFEKLYEKEGGDAVMECSDNELRLEVRFCPAIRHMREKGFTVARLFRETTQTVNEAICAGTPFSATLAAYDEETGRSIQIFSRRPK